MDNVEKSDKKTDRLDEIKHLLELVDDRIGPDSSLRWLIGEVDRLRFRDTITTGELNVLSAIVERIVTRVSEITLQNPVTTDPIEMVEQIISEIVTLRESKAALVDQNKKYYTLLRNEHLSRESSHLGQLIDSVVHQRRGALTELAEIHDLAAEALGYQRAPTVEEDPNCPCPGDFMTGEHTAQKLVMELVRKYKEKRGSK